MEDDERERRNAAGVEARKAEKKNPENRCEVEITAAATFSVTTHQKCKLRGALSTSKLNISKQLNPPRFSPPSDPHELREGRTLYTFRVTDYESFNLQCENLKLTHDVPRFVRKHLLVKHTKKHRSILLNSVEAVNGLMERFQKMKDEKTLIVAAGNQIETWAEALEAAGIDVTRFDNYYGTFPETMKSIILVTDSDLMQAYQRLTAQSPLLLIADQRSNMKLGFKHPNKLCAIDPDLNDCTKILSNLSAKSSETIIILDHLPEAKIGGSYPLIALLDPTISYLQFTRRYTKANYSEEHEWLTCIPTRIREHKLLIDNFAGVNEMQLISTQIKPTAVPLTVTE